MNCLGKRFLFALVAVICVTVATIWLKYNGDIYFKLVTAITGLFIIGQSYTDSKNGKELPK